MNKGSSISRRIESCMEDSIKKNYESAMIHFFPALDKTAKKRRPKDGVGVRIREFISDQEKIIHAVATTNIIMMNVDGVNFPQAIYKFGRTSIAHEGELDKRLSFSNEHGLEIGHVWNLPPSYITALCVGVMIAPENYQEHIDAEIKLTFFDKEFDANELWGAEDMVKELISAAFKKPDLFNK